MEAFVRSLHTVFWCVVPGEILAFAITWLIHEAPLRGPAHLTTKEQDVVGEISGTPAPNFE